LQLTIATINFSFSSEEGYITCSSWEGDPNLKKKKKKNQEQFLSRTQFLKIRKNIIQLEMHNLNRDEPNRYEVEIISKR
jgi:hypothetical protein